MMKTAAALLLAVPLVLTSGVTVKAQGNDSTTVKSGVITPYYDYISIVGASLDIGSLGKAVSSGFVYYSDDHDATITIQLQKKTGTSWSNVKTWSESFSGSGHHSVEEEYYVLSGSTYRVVTIAKVKDGNTVLETVTSTSSEVSY